MNTPLAPTYDELTTLVAQLRAVIAEQADTLTLANTRLAALEAEIARLQAGGGPDGKASATRAPDWVKASTPKPVVSPPKLRKKRVQGFSHRRLTPTHEVVLACDACPDCGRGLSGGWERSRRQVIDLPPVTPTITDYVTQARYCGVCQKAVTPTPALSEVVVGQQTFGVGVVSLVAYLDTVGRLPIRTIARLLSCFLRLSVSTGQIVSLLHTVARQGEATYQGLQTALQASEYVHADETGWRESGQNGYVWSFSTPSVRYFVYRRSRAHTVPEAVLGEGYAGVIVSDFYAGYNYHLGLHQRCWVHLWRDVGELERKFATAGVKRWIARLYALYQQAKTFQSDDAKARANARVRLQRATTQLCGRYVSACLPQSVLCKRLVQYEAELYTFVEFPQVPCENNPAERSVRPVVIARKVSGGTRSERGSKTMSVLASLFGTWQARGEDALACCRQMLVDSQKTPAAQAA